MDNVLPPENNLPHEHPLPGSLSNQNPGRPPLIGGSDIKLGSRLPTVKEKPQEQPKKSIFEKEGGGASRSEFKKELAKAQDPYLNRSDRMKINEEMNRAQYSEKISVKDLEKYNTVLRKKESREKSKADRLGAKR